MEKGGCIDFSALERELQAAVEADKKYQRENEAKFRAMHQKVATYEEFRDIVLASHLKPLDRKDRGGAPRKQPWNSVTTGTSEKTGPTAETIQPLLSDFQPRTASEFMRDWRRFRGGSLEKYALLLRLGGEVLQSIFSAEVGFGLLGEFLIILSEGLQSGDYTAVIRLLECLSETGRFGLNLSLLSQAEQNACKDLFRQLQDTADVYSPPSSSKPSESQHHEAVPAGKLRCLMAQYAVSETEWLNHH